MKLPALCVALSVMNIFAADIELPELQVHAERPDAVSGPLSQNNTFTTAGLLLRSQGAQTDLGYRGASFSSTGIAIGGLALRHPQTEHFHAEQPFPLWIFTAPKVAGGAQDVLQGQGHAAATLHLGLADIERSCMLLTAGIGERNWHWAEAGAVQFIDGESARGGVAAFAGYERRDRIDYPDNDLDKVHGGGWLQRQTESARSDLVVGVSDKRFGARGYYGVNPDWPADERFEDRLLLIGHSEKMALSNVRFSALARETEDTYKLDFGAPDIYVNNHRTRLAAGMAELDTDISSMWSLHVRGSAETEELNSNRLGRHERSRGAVLLAPTWHGGGMLEVTAGGEYQMFSSESGALLPVAHVSLRPGDSTGLFAGYSERERQPSFTELNYESPGSLGNEGLEREKITTIEGGLEQLLTAAVIARVSVFQRTTRNTVDWVKQTADEPRWLAMDVGKVVTRGCELRGVGQWSDQLRVIMQYTWLERDAEISPYAARYVLDYPKHTLLAGVEWNMLRTVSFSSVNLLQVREKIESREARTGINGTLRMEWAPLRTTGLRLALLCDNLWGDDFEEYVGQPAAGRRWGLELIAEL